MSDNGIVIVGNTPVSDGEWIPVLFKQGVFLPLMPKLVTTLSKSKDEAIERARIALALHPEVRLRWAGSWVVPVNFRDGFKLGEKGEL